MGLAFGCKDCEPVFVVFALWNHKEMPFLQSVQVEGKVARGLNSCIREQVVENAWRAVLDVLDISQVMNGSEDLVGFSRQCTVFEQGTEG